MLESIQRDIIMEVMGRLRNRGLRERERDRDKESQVEGD